MSKLIDDAKAPCGSPVYSLLTLISLLLLACAASAQSTAYNQAVLADLPVAFWDVNATGATEPDLSGYGNTGTYLGGTPTHSTLPNGNSVSVFNGSSQYLTIPSNASFSIPRTGNLTWEAWIQPSTLQFPNNLSGYVDYLGKCVEYSPSCEWEARMYNLTNKAKRPNRLSAYVFNPGAGLGSGAYWQPVSGLFSAGEWLHVVGEYTTNSTPAGCSTTYPGYISIWVNGVQWNMSYHTPTGCMSQYKIKPQANNSPLNIGTVSLDSWFQGAIGKVAIYNYLLTPSQIVNHYTVMTGKQPTGSCTNACTF